MPLHGWVHYGRDYDNAFWDGEQMVFGDGKIFDRFTKSLDVIGHELTHGVTEHEAGLQYLNQSGALNESVSDVFGSLVKQFKLGQDRRPGRLADRRRPRQAAASRARRCARWSSPAPPGTATTSPRTWTTTSQTMSDNGGVHTNSGIPNKAFAELAPRAGRAGVGAGRADLVRDAARPAGAHERDLPRVRGPHVAAARPLHGAGSEEANAVEACWTGVGVSAL